MCSKNTAGIHSPGKSIHFQCNLFLICFHIQCCLWRKMVEERCIKKAIKFNYQAFCFYPGVSSEPIRSCVLRLILRATTSRAGWTNERLTSAHCTMYIHSGASTRATNKNAVLISCLILAFFFLLSYSPFCPRTSSTRFRCALCPAIRDCGFFVCCDVCARAQWALSRNAKTHTHTDNLLAEGGAQQPQTLSHTNTQTPHADQKICLWI